MRAVTNGGIDAIYPEYLCPIFNPCMIDLYGVTGDVTTTITCGDAKYVDIRKPHNGFCQINIAPYLHSFFGEISEALVQAPYLTFDPVRQKVVEVMVQHDATLGTALVFTDTLLALWAGVTLGEELHRPIRQRYYKKSSIQTATFLAMQGGGEVTVQGASTEIIEGYNEINLKAILLNATNPINVDVDGIIHEFTEDDSDVSCGIMLKWQDAQGYRRFYLFQEGEETITTKDSGEALPRFYSLDYGTYYGQTTIPQGFTTTKTKKLCAVFSTEEDRTLINTLFTAPFVWIVTEENPDGIPVTIKRGNIGTAKGLQDFEFEINLPAIPSITI